MPLLTPPSLNNAIRWNGMRVGLLGGSFNPPHEGHVHISLAAMKALKLDAVWWIVSPQNPLKTLKPISMEERIALSEDLIEHPKILVSDIERQLGTNITYHTIRKLKRNFARTDFVWISGMDNAHSIHRWNHWKRLLNEISMLHLSRNPAKSLVQNCPIRMYERQNHVFLEKAGNHSLKPGITYWMMQKKMVNISSTEIREKQLKSVS